MLSPSVPLELLASALILGFLLAIPIGPVSTMILQAGIHDQPQRCISLAAGMFAAELSYVLLLYLGLADLLLDNTILYHVMLTLGGLLVLQMAYQAHKLARDPQLDQATHAKPLQAMRQAFLITLVNPGILALLGSCLALLRQIHSEEIVTRYLGTTLLMIELGTMLWFLTLITMLLRLPTRWRRKSQRAVSLVCAVLLMLFALYLLGSGTRPLIDEHYQSKHVHEPRSQAP